MRNSDFVTFMAVGGTTPAISPPLQSTQPFDRSRPLKDHPQKHKRTRTQVVVRHSSQKKKKRGEFPRAWSSFSLLNFHLWIGETPWFSHNQLLFGSPQQQWQLKSLGWSGPLLRLHGPWARLFKRYIVTIFSCFVCDQSFVSQIFHEKTKRYQTKTKKKHTSI